MKEVEEFLDLCDRMGIPYHVHEENNATCVPISQAIFYFDQHGDFLCVEDDEMGNIRFRQGKERVTVNGRKFPDLDSAYDDVTTNCQQYDFPAIVEVDGKPFLKIHKKKERDWAHFNWECCSENKNG